MAEKQPQPETDSRKEEEVRDSDPEGSAAAPTITDEMREEILQQDRFQSTDN